MPRPSAKMKLVSSDSIKASGSRSATSTAASRGWSRLPLLIQHLQKLATIAPQHLAMLTILVEGLVNDETPPAHLHIIASPQRIVRLGWHGHEESDGPREPWRSQTPPSPGWKGHGGPAWRTTPHDWDARR